MSPSFPSEGKTALGWVKVLPFLCLLQIFHSPWELSKDHTLLKKAMAAFDQGSYWTLDKPRKCTAKMNRTSPAMGAQYWGSRVGTGSSLGTSLQPEKAAALQRTNLLHDLCTPHSCYHTPPHVPLPWAAPHRTIPNPQVFPEAALHSPERFSVPDLLNGSKKIFKSLVKKKNNHHPNPYPLFPHF